MDADSITALLRHICGQGRCFVVDGLALPVCQRCFGLYVGAALSGVWLLVSGLWRNGLPSGRLCLVQAVFLLAAMLGGMHVIELGPCWRVACGLWTGHVASLWLWGGARHLWQDSHPSTSALRRPAKGSELASVGIVAILGVLSRSIPSGLPLGWCAWTCVMAAGAAFLAVCVGAAAVAVAPPGYEPS